LTTAADRLAVSDADRLVLLFIYLFIIKSYTEYNTNKTGKVEANTEKYKR